MENAEMDSVEFMYMFTRLLSSISSLGQRTTLRAPRDEPSGELGDDVRLAQEEPSGMVTSCAVLVLDRT